MQRDERLRVAARTLGFMPENEGLFLHDVALRLARTGTWLEVGAYCGASTLYLGAAAAERASVLYSLDHHRGSEELQPGWPHFNPELVDSDGRLNSLPRWQQAVAEADLERTVIGVVSHSDVVAAHFATPLDLLFLDGGHGDEVAWSDYHGWTPKISEGGLLLIHDVFFDPRDGGRPPYEVYCQALRDGFSEIGVEGSLRVLRRDGENRRRRPPSQHIVGE